MCKIFRKSFFNTQKIIRLLKNASVGIIPTDTVYGFSGIVDLTEKRIKEIKGRDEGKPCIRR